jgi:hypothetical protein
MAALGSAALDEEVRGTGLAVLTTVTNLARFFASVAFGAVWTWAGLQTAVLASGIALVAAIVVTAVMFFRTRERYAHA